MKSLLSEHELHAYVDDALPVNRQREIDALLVEHAALRQEVDAYRAQKQGLHALFDSVLDEPIPDSLNKSGSVRRNMVSDHFMRWPVQLAAGWMIALVAGFAGWSLHGWQQPAPVVSSMSLPARAAVAHVVYSPDVRRPVEVRADQQEQLVAWLSKRTGVALRPPVLIEQGYQLVGGRLLPGQSGPVAQFMYEENSGQRLTLYVATDETQAQQTGFRFAREGKVNVFYWIDGGLGYALSAAVDRATLSRIADAVYTQLEARHPS